MNFDETLNEKSNLNTTFESPVTVGMIWVPVSLNMPRKYGWYLAALNPVNYKDFENDPKQLNSWRIKFGCRVSWFNNGKFWLDDDDVTCRVTHWAYCPSVPRY